jgi:signal transduction histidine kinase/CheY-like chemotaxis protein
VKNKLPASLKGKVLITTAVGLITILVIYLAIDSAFDKITTNIDQLARPNERLLEVNRLFRNVSQLNHLQQKEAASGRRDASMSFIEESDAVYESLDTLQWLFAGDSLQLERVKSIDELLNRRREVFVDYLQLQYRRSASPDIRSFLIKIAEESRLADSLSRSRLVQTHKTTTTTTISLDTIREESSSFLQRLFGRTQESPGSEVVTTATQVDEEVVTAVDTINLVRADSLFSVLESSLDSSQAIQLQEAAMVQQREFQLLTVNNSLIHQMITIINALEQEEIARLNSETQAAFGTASDTIQILNLIAVLFIAVSLLLALIVLLDISKSNKYRAELEVVNEAVRQEAASKQRFLSNMSHEIRTPLQSIYGYAEQAKLSGKKTVDVDAIYQPAAHLLTVVNEVLDYAKVTSGRLTFDSKPFDLVLEVEEVVKALIPMASKKGIDLLHQVDAQELGQMEGDPFRLKQVLFNLIGNAIKFTNEGWVKVETTLVDTADRYGVNIAVRDTGLGIAAERLPHLFKEYSQGSNEVSEKFGGTGLGLSIVKNMVDMQGGRIDVESEPGKGSCFILFIPYKKVKNPSVINDAIAIVPTEPLDSGVVWMADDDALILNLGASILKKHGVEHRVFTNGQELLKAFDKDKPDVIFLDMRMPEMSGREVCERIRHRTGRHIQIYALTAQVLKDEQAELLESGFDGIVMKPFRESDLLAPLEGGAKKPVFVVDVNMSGLAKMAGDSVEEIADILSIVRVETDKDLAALETALNESDHEKLLLLVHRLAGRVGQVGALKYAMSLRDLESVLREPQAEINKDEIATMIQMGYGFIATLKHLLKTTYKV